MNQESTHLDVRKHGRHHGRCPANSTTVDAANVENKQARRWTNMGGTERGPERGCATWQEDEQLQGVAGRVFDERAPTFQDER